jgi:hypothetical protein
MVSHSISQCIKEADPGDIDNKFLCWVYYLDQTRQPLTWVFPLEAMEEAIDIARLYSQDRNVLNVIVGINQIRIATFAGYWEGRKYED